MRKSEILQYEIASKGKAYSYLTKLILTNNRVKSNLENIVEAKAEHE